MLRAGHGEPLLLLHGILGSFRVWKRVVPLLSPHHDVIAPSALGHRGGLAPRVRPVRVAHLVDDLERMLDELGIERAHVTGNSLGGWLALELARRGRALSACALSPAGAWQKDAQRPGRLRDAVRMARAFRPFMPVLAHSARVRRMALADNARHGERVSREDLLASIDDLLACTVHEDIFSSHEVIEPLSTTCPVTLAWAERDRIFPLAEFGARARRLAPDAHFTVLEGLGHVPMFDDPARVAEVILASIARAHASQ